MTELIGHLLPFRVLISSFSLYQSVCCLHSRPRPNIPNDTLLHDARDNQVFAGNHKIEFAAGAVGRYAIIALYP
ncbi:MAG: hypothetical protein R3E95_14980 [Thiolinea sp.]